MVDDIILHTLAIAIEDLGAIVIAPTHPDDELAHLVVLSDNQVEPYITPLEAFTLCGWSWVVGPARRPVPTCLECVTILSGIQGLRSPRRKAFK
jgi:hypothetical protein